MITVAQIFRFPVKGLGEELLQTAELVTGGGIPSDRRWAVAHGKSIWDAAAPAHISRRHFVQTADSPNLAQITTRLEGISTIAAEHPEAGTLTADLASADGREALCTWLGAIAGEHQSGPYHLAEVSGQPLWDVADAHLSLHANSTLKALSERIGRPLERRRFRGNVWLDGLAPGEEYDLIGQEITLGGLRLKVTEATGRCAAPGASPVNGRRDIPVTEELHRHYGHTNFGVYAQVISGGTLAVGDALSQ